MARQGSGPLHIDPNNPAIAALKQLLATQPEQTRHTMRRTHRHMGTHHPNGTAASAIAPRHHDAMLHNPLSVNLNPASHLYQDDMRALPETPHAPTDDMQGLY